MLPVLIISLIFMVFLNFVSFLILYRVLYKVGIVHKKQIELGKNLNAVIYLSVEKPVYFVIIHKWWLSSISWEKHILNVETDEEAHDKALNLIYNGSNWIHKDYYLLKIFKEKVIVLKQPSDVYHKIVYYNDNPTKNLKKGKND